LSNVSHTVLQADEDWFDVEEAVEPARTYNPARCSRS
jgi:hypothetical protein